MMDHATVAEEDAADKEMEELKVELRNRLHRIYSSVFLLEHKMHTNKSGNAYAMHEYLDSIQKELDGIRDRIIH